MKKLLLSTLLFIFAAGSMNSAFAVFNNGYYGHNQANMDAGKLITYNPSTDQLAFIQNNPAVDMYDFTITITDLFGNLLQHKSIHNLTPYVGYYMLLEPTNFLYLPNSQSYMITGIAHIDDPDVGAPFKTLFYMRLENDLNPTDLNFHVGYPFTTHGFGNHDLVSYSAATFHNPWIREDEVIVYSQMYEQRDPASSEIVLIRVNPSAQAVSLKRVDMPAAYSYRMKEFQISSIDLFNPEGAFLATGWVEDGNIGSKTPFIFEFWYQNGDIPSTGNLHHYPMNDVLDIGNTHYDFILGGGIKEVLFTYSHMIGGSGFSWCTRSGSDPLPAVSILSLDPSNLTPVFRRELNLECHQRSLNRPFLFTSYDPKLINVGFSQLFQNIPAGTAAQMSSLVYETDLQAGGSSTVYRYNFFNNRNMDFSFQSACMFPDPASGDLSYAINFTNKSNMHYSHLAGTTPLSLRSYCTDLVRYEENDYGNDYIYLEAYTEPDDESWKDLPLGWDDLYEHTIDCSSYRPLASNSLQDIHTDAPFSIFPNPVSTNRITINGPIQPGDQLSIMNATGQLIFQQVLTETNKTTVELPHSLATGVYMVQITNNRTTRHTDKLYILK